MGYAEGKLYYIIYKTTCLVTNRYYIGMHACNSLDDGYLGSGKILQRSIRKYGIGSHKREIISFEIDYRSLQNKEREIVTEEMIKDPLCLNIKPGGWGWGKSFVFSTEVLKKMRENKQTQEFRDSQRTKAIEIWEDQHYRDKFYSTVTSQEYKDKRSKQMKKIYDQNPHLREILSKGKSGSKNPAFGKVWIHNEYEKKLVTKQSVNDFMLSGWKVGRGSLKG